MENKLPTMASPLDVLFLLSDTSENLRGVIDVAPEAGRIALLGVISGIESQIVTLYSSDRSVQEEIKRHEDAELYLHDNAEREKAEKDIKVFEELSGLGYDVTSDIRHLRSLLDQKPDSRITTIVSILGKSTASAKNVETATETVTNDQEPVIVPAVEKPEITLPNQKPDGPIVNVDEAHVEKESLLDSGLQAAINNFDGFIGDLLRYMSCFELGTVVQSKDIYKNVFPGRENKYASAHLITILNYTIKSAPKPGLNGRLENYGLILTTIKIALRDGVNKHVNAYKLEKIVTDSEAAHVVIKQPLTSISVDETGVLADAPNIEQSNATPIAKAIYGGNK